MAGRPCGGVSVIKLLAALDAPVPDDIRGCAGDLDKVYIPARYPDAFDAGAPMDYYCAADSEKAINCANRVLEWLDALAAK